MQPERQQSLGAPPSAGVERQPCGQLTQGIGISSCLTFEAQLLSAIKGRPSSTRHVIFCSIRRFIISGLRSFPPKMTGTLISDENFSIKGVHTPSGVRSVPVGTALTLRPISKLNRLTPSYFRACANANKSCHSLPLGSISMRDKR